MISYTLPFIIGLFAFIGLFVLIYSKNKKLLFRILYTLPLVSNLIKEIDLVRFTRSLHYLLTSGIPIVSALELTEGIVIRTDIAVIIRKSKDMIISGKKLSEGLKSSKGKIPSIMIKIIEAGEKSGTLDNSLKDISEYLDYQVSNSLKTLTVLMEPIMLVLVGIVVGGMMLAIIAPIYNLIGQVGNR